MEKLSILATWAVFFKLVLFGCPGKAQTVPANAWRFGIGLENGFTTGAINNASNYELGATARLQYGVSKNLALTLTSGYYNFFGNQYHKSMGMVPLKVGFKAFVGSGFYFSGEAGLGFERQNFDVYKNLDNGVLKSTKLILSPGFGYATKSWDFGARFESFSGQGNNYGLIGLRVAYGFGL